MTFRIPLIDADNIVVNITTMEAGAVWKPPAGLTALPHSDTAEVGDIWDGQGGFSKPPPVPRTTFLARDLVSLLAADDFAKITGAAAGNSQIGLWLAMLYSRGEKPIDMNGPTFPQAWAAMVSVLGNERADQLLAALQKAG